MPVKGLPASSSAPERTRIQLEIVADAKASKSAEKQAKSDKPKDTKSGDSEAAVRERPRDVEAPPPGYEASRGRRRGRGPRREEDAPPPPPPPAEEPPAQDSAPAQSTPPPSSSSTPTASTPKPPTLPLDKGPRVRIQLEIARDAGLSSRELESSSSSTSSSPTSSSSASSSSSSKGGTTIQNQLLINGAGFTTGLRESPSTSSSSESSDSSNSPSSSEDVTSYQSPTQLLQEYYAQEALSSLTTKK